MANKVDILAPVKTALGIVALIMTYGTPLFWLTLWLFVSQNVSLVVKFRK